MATTYTPHLHLGLQESKADNFDFDLITANWGKIDNALSKAIPSPIPMCLLSDGSDIYISGLATFTEVE